MYKTDDMYKSNITGATDSSMSYTHLTKYSVFIQV